MVAIMWVLRREDAQCLFKSMLIRLKDWMIDADAPAADTAPGCRLCSRQAHLAVLCPDPTFRPEGVSQVGAPGGRPLFQLLSQSWRRWQTPSPVPLAIWDRATAPRPVSGLQDQAPTSSLGACDQLPGHCQGPGQPRGTLRGWGFKEEAAGVW